MSINQMKIWDTSQILEIFQNMHVTVKPRSAPQQTKSVQSGNSTVQKASSRRLAQFCQHISIGPRKVVHSHRNFPPLLWGTFPAANLHQPGPEKLGEHASQYSPVSATVNMASQLVLLLRTNRYIIPHWYIPIDAFRPVLGLVRMVAGASKYVSCKKAN